MVGEYKGSGGLTINFHPESATTVCGETEWTDKYAVVSTGKGVLIKLQNGRNPFAMRCSYELTACWFQPALAASRLPAVFGPGQRTENRSIALRDRRPVSL
jgi:hypothetical protein